MLDSISDDVFGFTVSSFRVDSGSAVHGSIFARSFALDLPLCSNHINDAIDILLAMLRIAVLVRSARTSTSASTSTSTRTSTSTSSTGTGTRTRTCTRCHDARAIVCIDASALRREAE